MIVEILKEKNNNWIIGVHIVLGILVMFSSYFLVAWYYFLLFSSIYKALIKQNSYPLHLMLVYTIGIEMLGRMLQAYPFIPWETGKYVPLVLVLLSLVIDGINKSSIWLGVLIITFALPGYLLGADDIESKNFATLGIINLGAVAMYYHDRVYTLNDIRLALRSMLFPLIIVVSYLMVGTPSITEVEYDLNSNAKISGGLGANQVSTILGLGFAIVIVSVITGYKVVKNRYIELGLLALLLIRGLVTFSRGGIMIAAIAVAVFFVIVKMDKGKTIYGIKLIKIKLQHIILGVLLIVGLFFITNYITGGMLLLRYQGETRNSLAGEEEVGLDSFTTGRFDIFYSEVLMWLGEDVFLGVGGGNSLYLHRKYGAMNRLSHTEISRLLAEHGVLGLLIIFILFYPVIRVFKMRKIYAAFILLFWIIAIGTSMHAAMRTMVTTSLFGLSLIRLKNPTPK